MEQAGTRSCQPACRGSISSVGVDRRSGHRAEESEHRQVLLGMAAVDGRIDEPRPAVRPGQDVAPPEVAVHQGRAAGREELSSPVSHGRGSLLDPRRAGQLQGPGPVEGLVLRSRARGRRGSPDPRRAAAPVRGGRLVRPRQARGRGPRRGGRSGASASTAVVTTRSVSASTTSGTGGAPERHAELAQPVGFVEGTGAHLGDEVAPACLDQPGRAAQWSRQLDRAHDDGGGAGAGASVDPAHARTHSHRRHRSPSSPPTAHRPPPTPTASSVRTP